MGNTSRSMVPKPMDDTSRRVIPKPIEEGGVEEGGPTANGWGGCAALQLRVGEPQGTAEGTPRWHHDNNGLQ